MRHLFHDTDYAIWGNEHPIVTTLCRTVVNVKLDTDPNDVFISRELFKSLHELYRNSNPVCELCYMLMVLGEP